MNVNGPKRVDFELKVHELVVCLKYNLIFEMLDKRTIRKMKFISDQEGIMNRYLREKDHWDLHLNRTKKFILDSFIKKERRSVAVLGSGWLLDLPLNELVNRFEKILLVDINHPAQIRNKVRSYNNVEVV